MDGPRALADPRERLVERRLGDTGLCDDGGDVLIGWSYFQTVPEFNQGVEFEPSGYFRKKDWFKDTVSLVLIGDRVEKPPLEDIYRRALLWALEIAKIPRVKSEFYSGLAAYQAWANALKKDEDLPLDNMPLLTERYHVHMDMMEARSIIEKAADEFADIFGRHRGGLVEAYEIGDAEVVLVSMGSVLGTMRDAVDELRDEGIKVGILKVRCFRPFPKDAVHDAIKEAQTVGVIEKDISLGLEGTLCSEMRAAFCGEESPEISSFIMGLGGRDITIDHIKQVARDLAANPACRVEFRALRDDLMKGDEA